ALKPITAWQPALFPLQPPPPARVDQGFGTPGSALQKIRVRVETISFGDGTTYRSGGILSQ
ncbi:MAG: hypothetical protein ACREDR_28300, partial [Blastocatellia bacterium]